MDVKRPRKSWYDECRHDRPIDHRRRHARVLDRNPSDRAVRIDRAVIEGCYAEMTDVGQRLLDAEKDRGPVLVTMAAREWLAVEDRR